MKLLSLTFIALLFAPGMAHAKKAPNDKEIHALITKIKHRSESVHARMRAFSDPLIRFAISPGTNVEQGQSAIIYATLNSGFSGSETFLADAKFDGANVTLEHPSEGLWIFAAGSFTELLSHTLSATVYIQDSAQAKSIRDAVQSLESQILDLNNQISQATDPDLIAQLTAQRDQKMVLKNELVAALANLKNAVKTEQATFAVVPATTGTDFPQITAVNPNFGKFDVTTNIAISGVNFPIDSALVVNVDGQAAADAVVQSSTTIAATTPILNGPGPKDIELRFTKDGQTKNVFFRNGYFAGDTAAEVERFPVAITGPNQSVNLGSTATFSGTNSYDPNGHEIFYSWQIISKPAGSALTIPTSPPGSDVNFSVTPDVPGSYVISLSVAKASPAMTSQPSLVVLEAIAPANRAPSGSAPSITVSKNFSKTSQITAADPDFWQQRAFFVTKQSAFGSATVSSAGLVSFTAGANPGVDTLDVTIVDNGTPQLSSVVSIPVTVVDNLPPVIQGTPIGFIRTQGVPYQARIVLNGVTSSGISDSDGTVANAVWDFGDGTHERTLDFTFGSILHNYMQTGTYTVTLTATDNLGATTSVSSTLNVVDTDIPTVFVKQNPFYGSLPLTVNYDASAASDADGIVQYRWAYTGTAAEDVTSTPFNSHTFNFTGGSIGTRFRFRDIYNAEGEVSFGVFPGQASPSFFPISAMPKVVGNREVHVGTPVQFDGSRSQSAVIGQDITNHRWRFNDFLNCPSCIADNITSSYTYTEARNHNVTLQVTGSNGQLSSLSPIETWTVNAGHAPRGILRVNRTSGPAPLTINMDSSESYDYDGTLVNHFWNYGDGPGEGGMVTAKSHIYNTPGIYNITLTVVDNDGNSQDVSQLITVTGSKQQQPVKKLSTEFDPIREYERQMLTASCFEGAGEACYQLGQMYSEDGDEYTKTKLWEKACGLGYADACGKR